MIIAIDGYEANIENRVGIGRYAYEILRNLYSIQKQRNTDTKNDCIFRIYLPEAPKRDMPEETPWWRYRVVPVKRLWTFVGLPVSLALDQPRADVIFSPTHYSPRFTAIPKVMSVMDVSYVLFPSLFKATDLTQLTSWTKDSVKRARHILTISKSSKNDIIRLYHVPQERVTVTYPGLSDIVSMKTTKKTLPVPDSYILSVGTLQPRKNFEKLIEAYSTLKKSPSFPDLVIVGKKGWLYEDILAAPKKFHVEDSVRFLEFVSDAELSDMYRNAACFVLPSLYEGFGLPVLEAMSYKVPVVVSNVSSLPEIAGEAGIYVDPTSVESIARGIEQAIKEKGTAEEKKRIALGVTRVKLFSWEKAAKQTYEILKNVAGESHKGVGA